MSMYPGTGDMCPTCYKPAIYVGDVPTGGFPPGDEPWCTCNEVRVDQTQNHIVLDPVLGELKTLLEALLIELREIKEKI